VRISRRAISPGVVVILIAILIIAGSLGFLFLYPSTKAARSSSANSTTENFLGGPAPIPWSRLNDFPNACPAGEVVTVLNSSALTCVFPATSDFTYSTHACTDTTATTDKMMGFKLNYTTGATGIVSWILDFSVHQPATGSSSYRLTYGTGAAPSCNGVSAGTTTGDTHTLTGVGAGGAADLEAIDIFSAQLSPHTTYWVDLTVSDSTGASWIYSQGELNTLEVN